MKILYVCEYLPLEGLPRENDIHFVISEEINKLDDSVEFVFLKSIPWSSSFVTSVKKFFGKSSTYGEVFRKYLCQKTAKVRGYPVLMYPWFRLPVASFWLDSAFIQWNIHHAFPRVDEVLEGRAPFDLIISQNDIADGIVANYLSKKYGIPHIHVLRGTLTQLMWGTSEMKKLSSQADRMITPSPEIHRFMDSIGRTVSLFPHGVSKAFFSSGEKDFSRPRLITVARLFERKHIDWVLRALKVAMEKGLDFEYRIIGDGPQKERIASLVEALGLSSRVTLCGWVSHGDVVEQMKNSNVMVLPSNPETLGRVFIEAAAAKCLCIGHKGHGADGLFKDRESAIFTTEQDMENDISWVLSNLNSDGCLSMIEEAYEIASSLCWPKVAQRYIELFHDVKDRAKL